MLDNNLGDVLFLYRPSQERERERDEIYVFSLQEKYLLDVNVFNYEIFLPSSLSM
jgi:hypothetical protein